LRQETYFVESGLDNRESELYNLQLVFLIDVSGSMEEKDVDPEGVGVDGLLGRGKWTRYDNMVKILKISVEIRQGRQTSVLLLQQSSQAHRSERPQSIDCASSLARTRRIDSPAPRF
jgi:hypothetical protein